MALGLVFSLIIKVESTFFHNIGVSFFIENFPNGETVLGAHLSRVEDQLGLFLGVRQMLSKQSLIDLGPGLGDGFFYDGLHTETFIGVSSSEIKLKVRNHRLSALLLYTHIRLELSLQFIIFYWFKKKPFFRWFVLLTSEILDLLFFGSGLVATGCVWFDKIVQLRPFRLVNSQKTYFLLLIFTCCRFRTVLLQK